MNSAVVTRLATVNVRPGFPAPRNTLIVYYAGRMGQQVPAHQLNKQE